MIELSPRLKAISHHVIRDEAMADIGCDHGYLPCFLIQSKYIPHAIATDLNKKSLEKTISLIRDLGLEKKIEPRLGNGLISLREKEVSTVTIAGMGGYLIRDILSIEDNVFTKTKRLILQPMNNANVLREFLFAGDFKIINEECVQENRRFYEIIVVEEGKMVMKDTIDLYTGYRKAVMYTPAYDEWLETEIKKIKKILYNLENKNTHIAIKKRKSLENFLTRLTEVRKNAKK